MSMKRLATAVVAASLIVTPTLATAQSAPAPQTETVRGDSKLVDRAPAAFPWLPVGIGIALAIALGWWLLDEDKDEPVSP